MARKARHLHDITNNFRVFFHSPLRLLACVREPLGYSALFQRGSSKAVKSLCLDLQSYIYRSGFATQIAMLVFLPCVLKYSEVFHDGKADEA
jgi:hypothetical protein